MRRPDYDRRVVVTGLGVISPVGNDKATAWSNLVNGVSGLDTITKFDMYQAAIPVSVRVLTNLRGIIEKAESWAAEKKIDQSVVLNARLALDTLQQAIRCGFKDVDRLKGDSYFQSVREHADFKAVLARLEP